LKSITLTYISHALPIFNRNTHNLAADFVARKAKEIAVEDRRVMSELERTGDRLSDAIGTMKSLTDELRGVEGGADVDSVSDTVKQTVAIVREFEKSAEDVADAVGRKIDMEADAVMAIDEKAADSVDAVRAAGASVRDVDSSGDESIRAALMRNAEEIRADMDTGKRLAKAIRMDISNDEGALDALESGSRDVDSLVDAVNEAVDKAADSVAAGGVAPSGNGVAEAMDRFDKEIEVVEGSMSDVKEAAEKCHDCNVKEIAEEIEGSMLSEPIEDDEEENIKEYNERDVEVGGDKPDSEGAKESEEEEIRSQMADDHDEAGNESKSEVAPDIEKTGGESGQEVDASAHEEVSAYEVEDESESFELLQGAGRESMHKELPETILSGVGDDVGHLDNADEVLKNVPEPTNNIIASMTDAAAEPTFPNGGDFVSDSLASVDPQEDFENVVVNTARLASEVGDSAVSVAESARGIATWTTEAVAEAVTMISTLFI
jgi:hypothetical protein